MKRFALVLAGVATSIALTASQALASYPPSKPPAPSPDPADAGTGGVAFTGANISVGVIILIALIVVGSALLLASRRRRTDATAPR